MHIFNKLNARQNRTTLYCTIIFSVELLYHYESREQVSYKKKIHEDELAKAIIVVVVVTNNFIPMLICRHTFTCLAVY